MEMCNLRVAIWIVFLCCLVIENVKSDTSVRTTSAKNNSNRPAKAAESKSQPEKRDSQKQEVTKSSNNVRQHLTNDEPFRPIYPPEYAKKVHSTNTKNGQYFSQAIVPQAEAYYGKPLFMNGIRYDARSHNQGSSTTGTTANILSLPSASLVGSHMSSVDGVRVSNAYRGPYNPAVYQQKPHSIIQKQALTIAGTKIPSPTHANKIKGTQQYTTSAYDEPITSFLFNRPSKSLQLKGNQNLQHQHPEQQRLILQPLHQYKQPYIQFYNPHQPQNQHQSLHHQQFDARAAPQQPQQQEQQQQKQQSQQQPQQQQQQYYQYIIAVPLSYLRQMQHELATSLSGTSSQHETPLSASKTETPATTVQPIIGPLARDHYGSYRPVHHYTSNHQAQHVAPSSEYYINQKPQYTTQYIQIPASVLNAATAQAAHHQHQHQYHQHAHPNRLNGQDTNRESFQHPQPQYTYNIYPLQQQQQQLQPSQEIEQEQQRQQHHHIYVQPPLEKPRTQGPLQEAIIHVKGAKPSANSTPTKTYNDNNQIPPTLTLTSPSASPSPSTSTTPYTASSVHSILTPPAPPTTTTALAETSPIVHYNPIYVQGPPSEQQSLFGAYNYHRFATGGSGFQHATTPNNNAPFVRLSAPSSHSYYYSSFPHHHPHHHYQQLQSQSQLQSLSQSQTQPQLQLQPQQFHTGLEHKTIYGGYASEQIPHITAGLPYLAHPNGIHYGTHLYHPTAPVASVADSTSAFTPASTFIASPSIAAKAAETENRYSVRNQHQQPEQQHLQQQQQQHQQQSYHPHYASTSSSSSSSSKLSLPSILPANISPTADGNAETNPLVKYP